MQNYSRDAEIANIEILLEKFLNKNYQDTKFSIEGNDIDFPEVSRHFGFLGLFVAKANDLYKEIFDKDLPVDFWPNENTLLDCEPMSAENADNIFIMLSHFTIHVLEEYIKQHKKNKDLLVKGRIPLDPLYQEWLQKIYNKKIAIKNISQNNPDSTS